MTDVKNRRKIQSTSKKSGKSQTVSPGYETPMSQDKNNQLLQEKFPNFFSLTDEERSVFRATLLAARRNIEKRENVHLEKLGTIHDEFLSDHSRKSSARSSSKGGKESGDGDVKIPKGSASNSIAPRNIVRVRYPRVERPVTRTLKRRFPEKRKLSSSEENFDDGSKAEDVQETSVGDHSQKKKCTTSVDSNLEIQNKLDKKEFPKNEQQVQRSSQSVTDSQKPDTESNLSQLSGDLPAFKATKYAQLSPEEKRVFFQTLQTAYSNIIERNPGKKEEIIAYSDLVRMYSFVEGTSPQFEIKGDKKRHSINVKMTVLSKDNERNKIFGPGPSEEVADEDEDEYYYYSSPGDHSSSSEQQDDEPSDYESEGMISLEESNEEGEKSEESQDKDTYGTKGTESNLMERNSDSLISTEDDQSSLSSSGKWTHSKSEHQKGLKSGRRRKAENSDIFEKEEVDENDESNKEDDGRNKDDASGKRNESGEKEDSGKDNKSNKDEKSNKVNENAENKNNEKSKDKHSSKGEESVKVDESGKDEKSGQDDKESQMGRSEGELLKRKKSSSHKGRESTSSGSSSTSIGSSSSSYNVDHKKNKTGMTERKRREPESHSKEKSEGTFKEETYSTEMLRKKKKNFEEEIKKEELQETAKEENGLMNPNSQYEIEKEIHQEQLKVRQTERLSGRTGKGSEGSLIDEERRSLIDIGPEEGGKEKSTQKVSSISPLTDNSRDEVPKDKIYVEHMLDETTDSKKFDDQDGKNTSVDPARDKDPGKKDGPSAEKKNVKEEEEEEEDDDEDSLMSEEVDNDLSEKKTDPSQDNAEIRRKKHKHHKKEVKRRKESQDLLDIARHITSKRDLETLEPVIREEIAPYVMDYVRQATEPKTKTRILQDLLRNRAVFVKNSSDGFVVMHKKSEVFEKSDRDQTVLITDMDAFEEDTRKTRRYHWQNILDKILAWCGKKEIEDSDAISENLKGESVAVDIDEKAKSAANATLDTNTLRILMAAKRKRILAQYTKT